MESSNPKEMKRLESERDGSDDLKLNPPPSKRTKETKESANASRNVSSFFDFEKNRSSFFLKKSEVWAVRDEYGMPRRYVVVEKDGDIHSASVRYLEYGTDFRFQKRLHTTCGMFHACGTFVADCDAEPLDPPSFSHKVVGWEKDRRFKYMIYPKKSEVWAFTKCFSSLFGYNGPSLLKYQMVEVLEDYDSSKGTKVAPLVRINGGYGTLFQRLPSEGHISPFYIQPRDVYRISHQVPYFRVSGEMSLDGCFELDSCSLPFSIDDFNMHSSREIKSQINETHLFLCILDKKAYDLIGDGAIWAVYDDHYGVPLKYVAIKSKKFDSKNKLVIHELVPSPTNPKAKKWHEAGLPLACGSFVIKHVETEKHFTLSHRIKTISNSEHCNIYPEEGDVWGIYNDQNLVKSCNLEVGLEYQIVLITYRTEKYAEVAYLVRVEGFKVLFRMKMASSRDSQFLVPTEEFYRFSHKITSYRFSDYQNMNLQFLSGRLILDPLLVPIKDGEYFSLNDPFLLERAKVYPCWSSIQYIVDKSRNGVSLDNQGSSCQQSENYAVSPRKEQEGIFVGNTREREAGMDEISPISVSESDRIQPEFKPENYAVSPRKEQEGIFVGSTREREAGMDEISPISVSESDRIQPEAVEHDIVPEPDLDEISPKSVGESESMEPEAVEHDIVPEPDLDEISPKSVGESESMEPEAVEDGIARIELKIKFHNFDDCKLEKNFELGQIWALHDESDGLPCTYARINKFITSDGMVEVTLLEPHPMTEEEMQWVEENLPMACGTFRASRSTCTKETTLLSHRIICDERESAKIFHRIFPRKGEVWAIYRHWTNNYPYSDMKNSAQYKLVEVLSDFTEEAGVTVAALSKVNGQEAVFYKQLHEGFGLFVTFKRNDLLRFSHCIPSCKSINDKDCSTCEGSIKLKFSHNGI